MRLDLPSDFDRLARLITGHAVGVVMAGGGARAFTHIGVVKALRASGVPIDQVGGTSMGAIVAAAVAARWTDEELAERFRRSFVTANPLSDYTLPFVSLFGGRRVTTLLRTAFGDKDIEDLVLPFYCVTANLTTANADTHTTGKLWRWLRASVSLPGVLPPFNDAGQVHVDGGVIDNLPVRVMRRQGRGLTIARRHRHRRRAGRRRRRRGAVVGLGVLPSPGVEARGDAADPLDRAHPAALGAGLERRPRDGGSRRGRPADRAADGAVSTCSTGRASTPPIETGYRGHHAGARQGTHPADRRADFRELEAMDYRPLGKTGLTVSVAGLGCGGNSRLGLGRGASVDDCVAVVRTAVDLGVNFLDTAEAYGTEEIVGAAVRSYDRDKLVISTKAIFRAGDTAETVTRRVEAALQRLGLDYVDIFHFHAVAPAAYDHHRDVLAPALAEAQGAGQGAPCRHHRDGAQRSGAEDAGPGDRGRPVGSHHAGLQPDEPGRAAKGLSGDRSAAGSARC